MYPLDVGTALIVFVGIELAIFAVIRHYSGASAQNKHEIVKLRTEVWMLRQQVVFLQGENEQYEKDFKEAFGVDPPDAPDLWGDDMCPF